jgi:sigma54-dependent transcription regulator
MSLWISFAQAGADVSPGLYRSCSACSTGRGSMLTAGFSNGKLVAEEIRRRKAIWDDSGF